MSNTPDPTDIDSAAYPVSEPPEELLGDLADVDLRGRDLRRLDFRGRELAGLHFEGARLDGADLRDCGLGSANLSGASLRGTRLEGAELSGADLTRADLTGAVLEGCTLERAVLHDATLAGAHARNSAWTEADVREGDWTGIDLEGASMHRVHLEDLDLRRATLLGVRIDDSDLLRVRLSEVRADGLQMTDCTVEDVETRGAGLAGATFRFANFERVDFEGANLDGVVFESVAFRAPRFDGVTAADARFLRCAGLALESLEQLSAAGAQVALPLAVRAWRAVGTVPGARIALVVLLVVVVGLGAQRVLDRLPGDDGDGLSEMEEVLASADDATQRRWEELQRQYQDRERRLEALFGMSEVLERLSLNDQAEERLQEAIGLARLRTDGSASHARVALGEFLLRTGRPDEAYDAALAQIEEAGSPDEEALGHMLLARALEASGDHRSALDELSRVTAYFGARPDASVLLRMETARMLEELGEASAAFAALQGIPDVVPAEQRAEAALLRAEMMLRAGHVAQAVQVLDEVLEQHGDLPLVQGRAREARAAALSGGPDPETEARQLEELAAADDPELAVQGELGLARLNMRMEDHDGAVARYRRVLERFPDRPVLTLPAVLELSRLHWEGGDTAPAVELLRQAEEALTGQDELVVVREELAEIHQAGGSYEEAERLLQRSLAQFEADPEVEARTKLRLAGIADQAGRVEQATRLYREVAGLQVDVSITAAALFGEATLQRRVGRTDDALPLMDQALEMLPTADPMRGAVAVERAETLVELGQSSPEDLEAMLAEAREAGIEEAAPVAYGELLVLLAGELMTAGRHDDALAIYQRVGGSPGATEDASLKHGAVEGQVAALVALGRTEQADALLEGLEVSQLSSGGAAENCDARMSLARGKAGTGDVEGAHEDYAGVLEACRSPRFLVQNLPVIADEMDAAGERERAVALLTELRDGEIDAVGRQAAELELGRLGSTADLQRAMAGPDRALASLARIERGEHLALAGRLAEAEPLWVEVVEDEAVEPVPRSLALIGLARLEQARGNPIAARGYLEEVKVVKAEPWLVEEAERLLAELRGE